MSASVRAPIDQHDRLGIALVFAVAIHCIVILGISFSAPKTSTRLEVTLANFNSQIPPDSADFIAQANQQGAGSLESKKEISTTDTTDFHSNLSNEAQIETLERSNQQEAKTSVLHGQDSEFQYKKLNLQEAEDKQETGKDEVSQTSKEISSLKAKLDRDRQEYAKRKRVKRLTSLSTRKAEDAAYMYQWQHYPPAARKLKIEGSLQMLVVIKANGQVEQAKILRSSGFHILDRAALRTVYMAAPYEAFDSALAKNHDRIEIIRTWEFEQYGLRSNGQ